MSSQMEKLSGWCHSLCRISSIAQAQRASQIISCPHQKLLPWCQWRPQSKPEIWVSVPFHTFACKHHKHGLGLSLVWQSEEILSSSEHQSALHFIYKLLSLNSSVFSIGWFLATNLSLEWFPLTAVHVWVKTIISMTLFLIVFYNCLVRNRIRQKGYFL